MSLEQLESLYAHLPPEAEAAIFANLEAERKVRMTEALDAVTKRLEADLQEIVPEAQKHETKQKRGFDDTTKSYLLNWLVKHAHAPYPTFDQKQVMAEETTLSITQIEQWFINARRRYVRKLN